MPECEHTSASRVRTISTFALEIQRGTSESLCVHLCTGSIVSNMRELTRLCRFERYTTHFSGCSDRKHSSQTCHVERCPLNQTILSAWEGVGSKPWRYERDRDRLKDWRPVGTFQCNHLGCHTNTQNVDLPCSGVCRGVQGWTRKIDILRTTCKRTVMIAAVEECRDA